MANTVYDFRRLASAAGDSRARKASVISLICSLILWHFSTRGEELWLGYFLSKYTSIFPIQTMKAIHIRISKGYWNRLEPCVWQHHCVAATGLAGRTFFVAVGRSSLAPVGTAVLPLASGSWAARVFPECWVFCLKLPSSDNQGRPLVGCEWDPC